MGASKARPQIPVLVVSGFLGAGKTTLVRHLLREAQRTGVRVAVVSNEFGALGIDQALLGEDAAAYVELEGWLRVLSIVRYLARYLTDALGARSAGPDHYRDLRRGVAL